MRAHRGMSIIEVLMGLSIAALMFASIATAMQAGTTASRVNRELAMATQQARVAMLHMASSLRQTDACQIGENPTAPTGARLVLPSADVLKYEERSTEVFRAYRYNAQTGELRMCRDADTTSSTDPVLARNVTDFEFRGEMNGAGFVDNVQISMTITVGDPAIGVQTVRLENSVVPRRAMALQ